MGILIKTVIFFLGQKIQAMSETVKKQNFRRNPVLSIYLLTYNNSDFKYITSDTGDFFESVDYNQIIARFLAYLIDFFKVILGAI